MRRLCVFCGSSSGRDPVYAESATLIGRQLAARGIGLVYGGGNVGLMGVVADACLQSGGSVIGVIPRSLLEKEVGHRGLTQLHVVETMHERKALMADLADGFLAMPGGYGTWDEFCEILTWCQLGLQRKAFGLLNVKGYYDPFLALADHAVQEGFLRPVHRGLVLTDQDPVALLDRLIDYAPPVVDKWLDRAAR
ncbi:MAG: TIGR00730 family Rossman fold protein [Bryobacteraceae bacterium]